MNQGLIDVTRRIPHRLRRRIAWLAFAALLPAAVPMGARAFQRAPGNPFWASSFYKYSVNTTSMSAGGSIPGLGLTADQVHWWTAWASSQWSDASGGRVLLSDLGSTPFTPMSCGGAANSANEVGARMACNEPACTTIGLTATLYNQSNGNLLEADICIFGAVGPALWTIANPVPVNRLDLVSVLVHEMGHAIGLDHFPNTVMNPSGSAGNTLLRFPFSDDVDGVQSIYGPPNAGALMLSTHRAGAGGWDTPQDISRVSLISANAAIGTVGNGPGLVIAHPSATTRQIAFARTAIPVGPNPTFTHANFSNSTYRPVAIATTPHAGPWVPKWLAGWIAPQPDMFRCSPVRMCNSPDAFADSSNRFNVQFGCSTREPAIAFDPVTTWWVAFQVVSEAPPPGSTFNTRSGAITVSTSPDGVTWAIPTTTGLYAVDSVDVACSNNQGCSLAFQNGASVNAYSMSYAFTINHVPNGGIVLGSNNLVNPTFLRIAQRTPAIAANYNGSTTSWSTLLPYFGHNSTVADPVQAPYTDFAESIFSFWFSFPQSNPQSMNPLSLNLLTWGTRLPNVALDARSRADIAADPYTSRDSYLVITP
jgi:hypothetical protein